MFYFFFFFLKQHQAKESLFFLLYTKVKIPNLINIIKGSSITSTLISCCFIWLAHNTLTAERTGLISCATTILIACFLWQNHISDLFKWDKLILFLHHTIHDMGTSQLYLCLYRNNPTVHSNLHQTNNFWLDWWWDTLFQVVFVVKSRN